MSVWHNMADDMERSDGHPNSAAMGDTPDPQETITISRNSAEIACRVLMMEITTTDTRIPTRIGGAYLEFVKALERQP